MCRLLGFTATSSLPLPVAVGPHFNQFVELSNVHKDSWGLALLSGQGVSLKKSAETAASSETFATTLINNPGEAGLLHFRWASPGLAVTDQNAHPFTLDGISFIHNGALEPYDALESFVAPHLLSHRIGTGDSELFFLYIMTEVEKSGFLEGVKKAISNVKQNFSYSSINSMIMNDDFLIVTSEHHLENKPDWAAPDYYELRYRIDSNGCVVASSGWNQDGWQLLANHEMLIVDRKTLSYSVEAL